MPLTRDQIQTHIGAFYEEIAAMQRRAERIERDSLGEATAWQASALLRLREHLRRARSALQPKASTS